MLNHAFHAFPFFLPSLYLLSQVLFSWVDAAHTEALRRIIKTCEQQQQQQQQQQQRQAAATAPPPPRATAGQNVRLTPSGGGDAALATSQLVARLSPLLPSVASVGAAGDAADVAELWAQTPFVAASERHEGGGAAARGSDGGGGGAAVGGAKKAPAVDAATGHSDAFQQLLQLQASASASVGGAAVGGARQAAAAAAAAAAAGGGDVEMSDAVREGEEGGLPGSLQELIRRRPEVLAGMLEGVARARARPVNQVRAWRGLGDGLRDPTSSALLA